MTIESDELRTENKMVVIFDICSSSRIIEDLKSTDHLGEMRNLLIGLKKFLVGKQESVGFIPYKFVGDGWILLFPPDVDGSQLFRFMEDLCTLFREEFRPVERRLEVKPAIIGLTFGIDKGVLIRIRMMGQPEYIGRALNVASRLQSAVKDDDPNPAFKCLMSIHAYTDLHLSHELRTRYHPVREERALRNIQYEKPCRCVKLTFSGISSGHFLKRIL